MDPNHLMIMIAIFSILTILRYTRPIAKFLFGTDENPSRWKWLVTPINLAISFIFVFVFNMTGFTTIGGKVLITLLLTAVTILAYEMVLKYAVKFIELKIMKKTKQLSGG